MTSEDYQDGLRDGRLKSLEQACLETSERIDKITTSVRLLERVVYALVGAIGLIQALPMVRDIL